MEDNQSLRQRVEAVLPSWRSWYPSVFDAAVDLCMLRELVCAPSSLMLSNRHARVQSASEQAHREKWGGFEDGADHPDAVPGKNKRRRRKRKNASKA